MAPEEGLTPVIEALREKQSSAIYDRVALLTVEDLVRAHMAKSKRTFAVIGRDGQVRRVRPSAKRVRVFCANLACVSCGIKGQYFAIERHWKQTPNDPNCPIYNVNLYAVKDGWEVLMTLDHIVPASKGGSNCDSNLQTMCNPCNEAKADTWDGVVRTNPNMSTKTGRERYLESLARVEEEVEVEDRYGLIVS